MNWTPTPPTEPGWYYLREDEMDDWCIAEVWPKVDGGFFIGDGKDVKDINALGYEWGGRVPAPGTTWTVEQIRKWLQDEKCTDEPERNATIDMFMRIINDREDGIAAVTARHRKEQG